MSDQRISILPNAQGLSNNDLLPIVQSISSVLTDTKLPISALDNRYQFKIRVTIGKSGSGADYITSNYASEDLAFQTASNYINGLSGGLIQVLPGTQIYTFANTVILYSNTTLDLGGNTIKAKNAFTGTPATGGVIRPSLFLNNASTGTTTYFSTYTDSNIHIINGNTDGNGVNQTTPVGGIGFQNGQYCTIENIYSSNFGTAYTGTGTNIESRGVQLRNMFRSHIVRCTDEATDGQLISICEECSIREGVVRNSTSEGFFLGYGKKSYVINCKAYNCQGYGGTITGSGFQTYDCDMINVYAENCGNSGSVGQYDGIDISGSSYRCRAINCSAIGSLRHGCHIDTAYNCQVIGGIYRNNSQSGIGLYNGINISNSDSTIIDNVNCYDDQSTKTQNYGIYEAPSSTNTQIGISNILINNIAGAISQNGSITKVTTRLNFIANPVLNAISDTNNNNMLNFITINSAVNNLGFQNNTAGFAPRIYATGSDTNISINLVPKGTGKIFNNAVEIPTISSTSVISNKSFDNTNTYKVTTSLLDTNGNTFLGVTPITSAVNYIGLQNNTPGFSPVLYVSGTDTNIDIQLNPKGTGSVNINSHKIINLSTPTSSNDAVNKNYVDSSFILKQRYSEIILGQSSASDVQCQSTDDFSVKLLAAYTLATSGTITRKIKILPGTYYQDTPLDLPFNPYLIIESNRWETAYTTNGVLIQWRGTGFTNTNVTSAYFGSNVTDYQVSMKGNTLHPTSTQTYDGSISRGIQFKGISFNGGNIQSGATVTVKCVYNLYFFNTDRIEIELCRFVNACGNVFFDSDMDDTAFDSSKESGGFYFRRCNFGASGDGTANSYAWIKARLQTQCWINDSWFSQCTNLDYGFYLDRSDKIKTSNCEFNNVKTALFYFTDTANVPVANNTFSGNVYLPGTGIAYVITNCVNSQSNNNSIQGAFYYNNNIQITNNGSQTNIVTLGSSTGYFGGTSNTNKLIKYIDGIGNVFSGVTVLPNGSVGFGVSSKLSTFTIQNATSTNATGTVSIFGTSTVTGTGTKFTTEIGIGDSITIGVETKTVSAIASDTSLTTTAAFTNTSSGSTMSYFKVIMNLYDNNGSSKVYVSSNGLIGFGTVLPTARIHVWGQADNVQLKVTAVSTQTKDLLQLVDSNNVILSNVDHLGNLNNLSNSVTGLAGNGFISLVSQSSSVAGGVSGVRLFADSSNQFNFVDSGGKQTTIGTASNTGNRTYILPDYNATLATLAGSENLTNKSITSPKIITNLLDSNGNAFLSITPITSAVNNLGFQNNTAGFAPRIYATGSDANISINLVPKGTGKIYNNAVEIPTISSSNTISNKALDNTNTYTILTPVNPSDPTNKSYVDGLVVGVINDRGNFDASVNTFPASGGSGIASAILKGNLWYISVAGTLGGVSVVIGDSVRALVDTPAQTSTNWDILQANIGYVPENNTNKSTSTSLGVSDTFYPSQNAVKTYVDTGLATKQNTLTLGNLTELTSNILTITGGSNAIIGSGLSIQVKLATTSQSGYLSLTDWTTFNSKQSSLGFTPENITNKGVANGYAGLDVTSKVALTNLNQSTTSTSGYLNSTDWNTFNSKQASIGFTPLDIAGSNSISGSINNSSTGYLQIPQGTTAQQVASPQSGWIRFNTTTARYEFYIAGSVNAYINHVRLSGDTLTGRLVFTASTISNSSLNIPTGVAPTTPVDGDVWYDSTQKNITTNLDGINQKLVGCIFTATANAANANSTSLLTMLGTGIGTKTLPANFWTVGKTIRITTGGVISNTGTPTLNVISFIGATNVASTGTFVTPTGLSFVGFKIETIITCRTTGATGTVRAQTSVWVNGSTYVTTGAGNTIIDTTAINALDVQTQWGTASTSNTMSGTTCIIEVLN